MTNESALSEYLNKNNNIWAQKTERFIINFSNEEFNTKFSNLKILLNIVILLRSLVEKPNKLN